MRPKCFFVISSTKLRQFRWNLVHCFLNKFAAKIYKHFPPHLNNVSTLPCETWNVHHAGTTTALSEKETPEIIPSQLWPSNSPDLNPVDYNVWEYCKKRHTKHASGWTETVTENGVGQVASCCHCGSHSSVALSIAADYWYMFCTPLLQYFLHAVIMLANLEATFEVG